MAARPRLCQRSHTTGPRTVSGNVLTNDTDRDSPASSLRAVLVTGPSGGSLRSTPTARSRTPRMPASLGRIPSVRGQRREVVPCLRDRRHDVCGSRGRSAGNEPRLEPGHCHHQPAGGVRIRERAESSAAGRKDVQARQHCDDEVAVHRRWSGCRQFQRESHRDHHGPQRSRHDSQQEPGHSLFKVPTASNGWTWQFNWQTIDEATQQALPAGNYTVQIYNSVSGQTFPLTGTITIRLVK